MFEVTELPAPSYCGIEIVLDVSLLDEVDDSVGYTLLVV